MRIAKNLFCIFLSSVFSACGGGGDAGDGSPDIPGTTPVSPGKPQPPQEIKIPSRVRLPKGFIPMNGALSQAGASKGSEYIAGQMKNDSLSFNTLPAIWDAASNDAVLIPPPDGSQRWRSADFRSFSLDGRISLIYGSHISSDGRIRDKNLYLYDSENKKTKIIEENSQGNVVVSPDGKMLFKAEVTSNTMNDGMRSSFFAKSIEAGGYALLDEDFSKANVHPITSSFNGNFVAVMVSGTNDLMDGQVKKSDNIILYDRVNGVKRPVLNRDHYWNNCRSPMISPDGEYLAFSCHGASESPKNPGKGFSSIVVYETRTQSFDFVEEDMLKEKLDLNTAPVDIVGIDNNGISFVGKIKDQPVIARYLFALKTPIVNYKLLPDSNRSIFSTKMNNINDSIEEDYSLEGSRYDLLRMQ